MAPEAVLRLQAIGTKESMMDLEVELCSRVQERKLERNTRRQSKGIGKKKEKLLQERDKVMSDFVDFTWMSESTQAIGQLVLLAADPDTQWSQLGLPEDRDDCMTLLSSKFNVLERRLERDVMEEHIRRVKVLKEWVKDLQKDNKKLQAVSDKSAKERGLLLKEQSKAAANNNTLLAMKEQLRLNKVQLAAHPLECVDCVSEAG